MHSFILSTLSFLLIFSPTHINTITTTTTLIRLSLFCFVFVMTVDVFLFCFLMKFHSPSTFSYSVRLIFYKFCYSFVLGFFSLFFDSFSILYILLFFLAIVFLFFPPHFLFLFFLRLYFLSRTHILLLLIVCPFTSTFLVTSLWRR